MKKVLVGISALLVATGVGFAADCTSGGKKCGCKPKKYRIVYVTAHNPDTMYDNSVFETTEVGPDYRMVPTEHDAAMYDRRVSYEDDDRYYTNNVESRRDSNRSTEFTGAYVGGRLGVDLLSWKNKYNALRTSAIVDLGSDHDKYTFEPVFGGGVFAGLHINPAWRADLEIDYAGKFSDSDNGFTFKLDTRHVTLNAYYDFINGFYLGLGAGMSFTKAELDWEHFVANSGRKTKTSFIGAGMLGYSYYMTERVALDLRYRLSGFYGPKWTRGVTGFGTLTELGVKTGLIWDNSFTVGVRFEF